MGRHTAINQASNPKAKILVIHFANPIYPPFGSGGLWNSDPASTRPWIWIGSVPCFSLDSPIILGRDRTDLGFLGLLAGGDLSKIRFHSFLLDISCFFLFLSVTTYVVRDNCNQERKRKESDKEFRLVSTCGYPCHPQARQVKKSEKKVKSKIKPKINQILTDRHIRKIRDRA